MAFRRGQCGFMYSALEALELPSSPPRIRNGLPSTMSCCVSPCFSSRGGAAAANEVASTKINAAIEFLIPGTKIAEMNARFGCHLDRQIPSSLKNFFAAASQDVDNP